MKDKRKKAREGKNQLSIWVLTAILSIVLLQKSVLVRAAEDSGYIFPDSAERYMSTEELEGLTLQIINYGKNEIYARHGRQFRSQELQGYFDEQDWYEGSVSPDDFDENSLNEYERINAHMINDFEHEINAEGYKLDQGEYSFDAVYDYIESEENNDFGEETSGVSAEDIVQHKSMYGTVTFQLEYQDDGQSLQGVIQATDIAGVPIWKRTTETYMCAGYAQVTDLGIHGNRYYYEEGRSIVAIRVEDGAILWKAVLDIGAPRCCFGENDMVYLCGYYGPDFVALDKGGQEVQRILCLDEDFAYATAIEYENGKVYVTKDGSASGNTSRKFVVDVVGFEQEGENKKENPARSEDLQNEEKATELVNEDPEKKEFETEDNNETEHLPETTVATYDEWIKENMIPALGLCSNGSFSNMVSSKDYGVWFEQSGILSRYEEDIDADGEKEALVIYLKREKKTDSEDFQTNLHLAVLKRENKNIQVTHDMDCESLWGMSADVQIFSFEYMGKRYFALQSFAGFNGISEEMTVFHVTREGKMEVDCRLEDPGYTSGLAIQKVEINEIRDVLHSDSDYENTSDLYNYDGTDEKMFCEKNPAYGMAFNEQIQPYGLNVAVTETMFGASMWRLEEENLTELCRIYAISEDLGMTTDGIMVLKYMYHICDNTKMSAVD